MNDNRYTKRTSHTQLPSGLEIKDIVAAESKRQHYIGKENTKYANFRNIIDLCDHLGINSTIFADLKMDSPSVLDKGAKVVIELSRKILAKQPDNQMVKLLGAAYDYLAEEDSLEKADYGFVFGSKSTLRAEKAIEIFKQGMIDTIIFSGHVPHYGDHDAVPEAKIFADLAIKAGVPADRIITESKSITIPDNIRRTLNMFDENHLSYKSFILVNSPYSQRRGWCVFKHYVSDDVKLLRCNADTKPEFDRENWYKNKEGLSVYLGEFVKLRNAICYGDG